MNAKPRVLKLGGSLLTFPDLVPRLSEWLAANPHPLTLMIVGGGQVVDSIRDIDRIQSLNSTLVHWTCIDLLDVTASIAAQLFPTFQSLGTPQALERWLARSNPVPQVAIVRIGSFYGPHRSDDRLPENWNTTSDSLAALLAVQVAAESLVLMKSCSAPAQFASYAALKEAGIVDEAFPALAQAIECISFVNLRSEGSS